MSVIFTAIKVILMIVLFAWVVPFTAYNFTRAYCGSCRDITSGTFWENLGRVYDKKNNQCNDLDHGMIIGISSLFGILGLILLYRQWACYC